MDDRLCAADGEFVSGAPRAGFVSYDEHGPRLDRGYVNGRLALLVKLHLPAITGAQSPGEREAAVRLLISTLIKHVDETVDAALAFNDDEDTPY